MVYVVKVRGPLLMLFVLVKCSLYVGAPHCTQVKHLAANESVVLAMLTNSM